MKMPKDDVLNALLTDLVADQVIRALELGFKKQEVEDAVRIGVSHGTYEHAEREKEMEKTGRMIERQGKRRVP
jgi:Arc/MetJ family transcription regulator